MMLHGSSVNNCDKDKNEKLSVYVPLKISPQKKKFHKNNEKERKKSASHETITKWTKIKQIRYNKINGFLFGCCANERLVQN